MDDLRTIENDLVQRIAGLREDIDAIQQPRSDFALRHFVVGAHDLPGRQRAQALLELQVKMFNIQRAQLDERRLLVKQRQAHAQRAEAKDADAVELAQIDIETIETDLAELRLARVGAVREARCLLGILDELPAYSREQLQAEEAEYWRARLSRQALHDLKATGTIGQGNMDAIGQMFRELGKDAPRLDDGQLRGLAQLME